MTCINRRGLPLLLLLLAGSPVVQAGTTGTLRGSITNAAGEPIEGARVQVSSPSLQGSQSTTTGEKGFYRVFSLPPGIYTVEVVIPGVSTLRREGVKVGVDQTLQVDLAMSASAGGGEGGTIVITAQSPVVDQGSTGVGVTMTSDFTDKVAAPRTTTEVLGMSPGATTDGAGTGFGGSTSAENNIIIDGVNTTNIRNGLPSTALPMEFVEEMQVKTGGYEAEFGRATGAVVNVRTRTGGNEFHGDVWTYIIPFEAKRDELVYGDDPDIAGYDNAVRVQRKLGYDIDLGADLGGPIIKDKLWFWVGIQPTAKSSTYTRTIGSQEDTYFRDTRLAHFAAKLSYKPAENHDVSVSVYADPQRVSGAMVTTAGGFARDDAAIHGFLEGDSADAVVRYNGKFNDGSTNVEVLAGYHSQSNKGGPEAGNTDSAVIHLYPYTPTDASGQPMQCENMVDENGQVVGEGDCEISGVWRTGSPGGTRDDAYKRYAAQVQITHYIDDLLGHHKLKYGADVEINQINSSRGYVGGELWQVHDPTGGPDTPGEGYDLAYSYAYEVPVGSTCEDGTYSEYIDLYTGEVAASCQLDSFKADSYTTNTALFLQDAWRVKDNLTLSMGVRWDIQQLRDKDGNIGVGVYDNIAPRLGFIWDPGAEGKSKIFGSFGRFYESIPLAVNDRSFSQEGTFITVEDAGGAILFGGENSPVQKGLKGQYNDEFILGVEYEVAENMSVGGRVIHRSLGSVIEDISFDDGSSYAIANPGTSGEYTILDPETGEQVSSAQYIDSGDGCTAAYFDEEAGSYGEPFEVTCFDKATRNYDALELTAYKRLTDNWQLMASYVLSFTRGNYPGLFNPENGQLDANISSAFDLAGLLANREGALPSDQRHVLKVHGSYQFDWGLLAGMGFTAHSGSPYSYLGSDISYGQGEVFLAPRGTAGRLPWYSKVDANLGYVMDLKDSKSLTLSVAAFNLLNQKSVTAVDQNWTYDDSLATEGTTDPSEFQCDSDQDGSYSNSECTKNVNFGQTTAIQAPLRLRFGAKLTF